MTHKSKIGKRALIGILIFAALICLVSSAVLAVLYRSNIMTMYKRQIGNYAAVAAEFVDGDAVERYLKTGEKDDYYYEVESYLLTVVKHSQLRYYYIFVPTDEYMLYVWDTDENADNGGLGEIEYYMGSTKEEVFREFSDNPEKKVAVTNDKEYGYLASAYAPIYNSKGEVVALAGADLHMRGIKNAQFNFLMVMVLCIIAVLAVFNVIFFRSISKTLILPLTKLNKASSEMVHHLENSDEVNLDIHTGDEIEDLANSFTTMHDEVQQYIKKLSSVTAEKERIGTELNVATRIQSDMLPTNFPEHDRFDLYALMDPAKEVGGDFYDFFMLDEDHIALVIADVSGKGVPAALVMVIAKTLIKNHTSFSRSPKEILEAVNNQLCENNSSGMFVTAWLCIMELSTGKCVAVNAGHEYPMIKKADGNFELLRDRHGLVLAGMEDSTYKEYEFEVEEGGTLFVYTDGAAEATNSTNELYGTDRILESLNVNPEDNPAGLIHKVKADIDSFVGEAPQFDDITMLSIKRNHKQ